MLFFFFQAEDGIRDFHVTGVQTCALPTPGVTQDRDGLGQDPGENRDGQGQEPGDRSGDDGYQQAELGGTLLLRGTEGEQVAVTVTKVFDRATPKSEIFTPKAGNRWVA